MADGIFEKVYNPDVLSCLANLSNDEVFTPPAVANQMLDMLPQELFSNPDAKFLDPATKSGVFLRETAKRLIKGLEHQIPDLNERLEHIFKHQLYGIAKIELLKPQEICTESYLCVGDYDNIVEAQNLEIYIKTKFCRFLLLQALSSMNITKDKFCYVPLQDFTKPWTDEELYQKYNLTDEEISFIESMIKPMDLGGENNAR